MINKDLGLVTAYAYAVSKGYTGTEDEFAELMASYASVASQAEESAENSEAWAVGKRGGVDVPESDDTYHNNSKYYAGQAGTSASNAASSASAASASESNAAASASSAAGSASSATTSAATATEKAGEASTSATAASTSATNAASSATAASASATAAGNAQTAAETAQGNAEDAQEAAEQAQSDAEAAAQSVSQSAAQISQNASDISDLKSAVNDPVTGLNAKAPVIIDTASGAIASFEDGADGLPLKALTVSIEPVQSGSGDPSPDNVRPISGWTGCEVANISDSEKQPYFAGLINGTYGFVDLGTLTWYKWVNDGRFYTESITDVKNGSDSNICSKYLIISHGNQSNLLDKHGCFGAQNSFYVKDSNYAEYDRFEFKAAMSGVYLVYELATPTTPTITQAQYNTLLQSFNIGGWLIPISWESEAGTVYGGTLDVTTGLLTVTMAEVDLGTLGWGVDANRPSVFYTRGIQEFIKPHGNAVCSALKVHNTGVNGIENGEISTVPSYGIGYIFAKDTTYTDATDFNAAMSGVQFVYELATPQTYQLTPTEVNTLLGTNNIWSDCGSVDVDYPADTKLFIQKVNAPTDDDMIADTQIASGKYFIIGNNLYLSTTTIPAGDTIIPGTNCTKTNLAEALNALNA